MDDAGDLFDDGDEEEEEAGTSPDPCPRCGRTHVALFYGERYQTFAVEAPIAGLHHGFFQHSLTRVRMLTCMDCGYIELHHDEMLKQHD